MLADEQAGFAAGLDGGLFDGGLSRLECVGVGGGDGEEAGEAQVAVAGDELAFALVDVGPLLFGGVVGELPHALPLGGVGLVLHAFLADAAHRLRGGERLGDDAGGAADPGR